MTIAVAHNRPCNNVAAICTSDGKRLSNRLERTIKAYLNNPATGLPTISGTAISEWWEIDVTPDSLGDVTIAVAHNRPCNNVAAICTSDGKRLSNRLERTIKAYLNNPATGLPTISGTAIVGESLTADTLGIVDDDGLENVSYSYQWLRNDGTTDSGIQDAVNSTYTLVSDDSGKAIKVRVSFTDDAGNEEALTSDATAVVAAATSPTNPATGAPTISGTAQVGETLTADTSGIVDGDGLSNPTFSYQWIRNDGSADADITDATDSTYALVPHDSGKTIKVQVSFTDDAGNAETLTSQATATVATRPNNPATGVPTINGAAQVGETLTVDTSGIVDEDGLENVSYSYQWFRNDGTTDSDIQDAVNSTYTLVSGDSGKAIKVRVSFTDDAGNDESLTSASTAAVNATVPGLPRSVDVQASSSDQLSVSWEAPAFDGGSDITGYTIQWREATATWDSSADLSSAATTANSYTISSLSPGTEYTVRVVATNVVGDGPPSAEESVTPNSPPTGQPVIRGTTAVGEILSVDTSGIADAEGLTNPVFNYRWLADDSEIDGATSSTYTLTSDDEGKAIKVRVSFTDDAGNAEALTSPPLDPAHPYGLTATASDRTVVLTWDPPVGFSYLYDYQVLRNRPELGEAEPLVHANTGTAETTYTDTDVEPGVLYVYRVKAASYFGRFTEASEPVEIRTPSWTQVENSPATGQPTISGAAQVGETLTADTSGIDDVDGLANATYSYQWLVDDIDITGATGASYTLADSDEGEAMKVRVTFTDDAGNAEMLTSDATAVVAAATRPNNPATGVPTISGAAQVGETLTADTSGIADADGLANGAFSYQWTRNDGSADADIQDASGSTYTLTSDDEGKTIRVRVTFTDDADNAEMLTSGVM